MDVGREVRYPVQKRVDGVPRNRRRTVRDRSLEVVRGETSIILELERNKPASSNVKPLPRARMRRNAEQ